MAWAKGALASTDPSMSTASSAAPSLSWRGRMRPRNASRPGQSRPARGQHGIQLAHRERRESAGKAGRGARGEDQFGRGGKPSRPAAARPERDRQAMLGLADLGRTVEQQPLDMAGKVGRGHEQVERMAVRDERRSGGARGHGVAGIEQQPGKTFAAKGRREPARADEAGELAPHFAPRLGRDGALDRVAAPAQQQPEDRPRPEFGEARERPRIGVNQHIGIGGAQPQVGQRLDRLAGLQRMGEEHAVDPARARPGDDVRHHAQAQLGFGLGSFEDVAIDDLAGRGRAAAAPIFARKKAAGREIATGAREMPDLLGDAVHVHGEADAAVADQREPEFLLSHGLRMARLEALVDSC